MAEITTDNWIAIGAIIVTVVLAAIGGIIKKLWPGKKDGGNTTNQHTSGDGQTIRGIQAGTVKCHTVSGRQSRRIQTTHSACSRTGENNRSYSSSCSDNG